MIREEVRDDQHRSLLGLTQTGRASACRTGCPTQDHESYAQCLKATTYHTLMGEAHDKIVAHDSELAAYRNARRQGIQPASTRSKDIEAAVTLSQAMDKPFDAKKGLLQ